MRFGDYEEMLRYIRWDADNDEALRSLLPAVSPRVAEIAEEFYDRIREHPEADAVFRDEAQVRRLKQTLQRWVIELLTGPHDERYFEQRRRIGAVHARIGLPQRYVFSAMSLIRLHLERISAEAFAGDPAHAQRVRIALGKILDVELSVMLETFRGALIERLERLSAAERDDAVGAASLRSAEARFRDAVESSPAIVVVLDEAERPLIWNRAAVRATGFERDELLDGCALERLIDDDASKARALAVAPGATDTFEATLLARSGRERRVQWSISSTATPAQGRLTHLLGLDVTEAKASERRARDAERLAAVGTLAAGLAHEIRNPLNAASLHVTLLERALKNLPAGAAAASEAASVLRGEVNRLSRLVSEFLEFARPKPIAQAPVELVTLVEAVLDLLRPEAEASGVELAHERALRAVWATGDEGKLRQVVVNLARNAIEAASGAKGGKVILRTRRIASHVEFDVEDTGPGVPQGAPIFDAFYTTKEQGTGLGLSIVHRVIDDHGGSVAFRSQPGETVFTVRLPGAEPPRLSDAPVH